MAADARWLKIKTFWQGLTRDKRDRVLGLLFIIAVAFIWVCISKSIPSDGTLNPHRNASHDFHTPFCMYPGFAGTGILPCPRPRGRGPQSFPADIHRQFPLHRVSAYLCPREAAHLWAEGQASSCSKSSAWLVCTMTTLSVLLSCLLSVSGRMKSPVNLARL